MLMSVIEVARTISAYPELAGKRVLITGVTSACGVDIVRAFAEHRTRLILQFDETDEPAQAISEIAAPAALDIQVFGPLERETAAVARFARAAVLAFGGLDVAVNIVPLALSHPPAAATTGDIEAMVSERLLLPFLIGKVAANRMGLTRTEGSVLNVATLESPIDGRVQAFAAVIKATLAALTRAQAQEWATQAVRCNAIAPQVARVRGEACLSGEPDVAALALYLASGRGKSLSGHVFEAEAAEAERPQRTAHCDYR
jgi:3-oxoacyl-[acyl-carrier protein] reductase